MSLDYLLLYILLFAIFYCDAQLHDPEATTEPSWAPTGRLHQFNGFATPRPSLLPQNAQMVYASVWAAWSAWSFCADGKRIRVRACNTVRGFRCLGPNQETDACDSSRRIASRPNAVSTDNDYDVIDPWQEDRIEALKQLYPDESVDEKLSRLPEHEKKRLLARVGDLTPSPPMLVSHELLNRPRNDDFGAPGSTPERMFGARAFAVKNSNEPVKFPELVNTFDSFKDATDITASYFVEERRAPPKRIKNRGEGTFSKSNKNEKFTKSASFEENIDENDNFQADEVPKFRGKDFTNDIFGSIDELMEPKPKTTTPTTTTTTTPTPTTTTTQTTTTTPVTTTTTTTTTRSPPIMVQEEENLVQVTPTIIRTQDEQMVMSFFDEQETTTRKPYKFALHYGEVTVPVTTTTVAPKELPEEISLDTLHALDWMLANMTNAANEVSNGNSIVGNELRKFDKASDDDEKAREELKMIRKKKKTKKNKKSKMIKLHYGDVERTKMAVKRFPKFRSRHAHRSKVFGIKTASSREINFPVTAFSNDGQGRSEKEERLVEELNDLQDLMEQLDERSESRSALMEPSPTSYPISKQ